jgi:hypothetical protein
MNESSASRIVRPEVRDIHILSEDQTKPEVNDETETI